MRLTKRFQFSSVLRATLLTTIACGPLSYARGFEAHEWGTFTSLVGSNGITQNGMTHEDEQLPGFVHGFGEVSADVNPAPPTTTIPVRPQPPQVPCTRKSCFGQEVFRNQIVTQKMETPVIYFYSSIPVAVDVNVKFPQGIITETFPAPIRTFPQAGATPTLAAGDTTFRVNVLQDRTASLPFVESANIYGHARNVPAANIVQSGSEKEKFIFYRGLGRFQPIVSIRSVNGDLSLTSTSGEQVPAAFLVHVDQTGDAQMIPIGQIGSSVSYVSNAQVMRVENHSLTCGPSVVQGSMVRRYIEASLNTAGLTSDEAKAMLDTWEQGYLKVPGLRVLYIMPRGEVDRALPLTMTPQPSKLVRAFVARIEVLRDVEEHQLLNEILGAKGTFRAESLGRFAEPILRRVKEVYTSEALTHEPGVIDQAKMSLIETALQSVAFDPVHTETTGAAH